MEDAQAYRVSTASLAIFGAKTGFGRPVEMGASFGVLQWMDDAKWNPAPCRHGGGNCIRKPKCRRRIDYLPIAPHSRGCYQEEIISVKEWILYWDEVWFELVFH